MIDTNCQPYITTKIKYIIEAKKMADIVASNSYRNYLSLQVRGSSENVRVIIVDELG